MKTSCGTGVRLLLVALLFLKEACILFAYSMGPSCTRGNDLHMSGTGRGSTSPPGIRETGSRRGAEPMTTRLEVLQKMAAAVSLVPAAAGAVAIGTGGSLSFPGEARAAKGGAATEADKEWISGKGAQPKGSDDKTGTRKESKYLRCLSNCLADCQKPTYGPEKDREECLQICQDECCTSYEQCTYTVTQNK
ncbi:unnamed protein product [Pylaiella littoralis]